MIRRTCRRPAATPQFFILHYSFFICDIVPFGISRLLPFSLHFCNIKVNRQCCPLTFALKYGNGERERNDMKLRPIKRASVFLNFFLSFLSVKGLSLVPPVRERPSFLRTNPQSALWFFLFLILWIGPAYLSSAASSRQKRTALGISFFYWICSVL